MDKDEFRNNEHYPDPTAYNGVKRADRDRLGHRIRRGEIYYIDGAQTAFSQSAGRPAIIVSNNAANIFSNEVLIVWLTRNLKKPLPTHVIVQTDCQCTALCEHIETVRKDRVGKYVGRLTQREMGAVDEALLVSIGLDRKEVAE